MSRKTSIFAVAAATAAAVALVINTSPAAHAAAVRTFVSGHGTDSGTCGVGSPCRTFAFAATQTAAAGEIVVLDSAGYGAVTITQSLTITNPGGVEAGVTAPSGGDAITINTTNGSFITLRGLTLEGGGVGGVGIDMNPTLPNASTSTLNIIGCVIKDFAGSGLSTGLSSPGAGNPILDVVIADSFFLNNTNGILVAANNAAPSHWVIYNTVIDGNGTGLNIAFPSSSPDLTLVNSHVDQNTSTGIAITTGAFVTMERSTALNTNNGFASDITNGGGTIKLFLANAVGKLDDTGGNGNTDFTNHIGSIIGTALTFQSPQ